MTLSSMPLSRTMSLLTLGYGVFALLKPRHLAGVLEASPDQAPVYDRLAHTYAGRDITISALGAAGPTRELVIAAIGLRIAGDLADAAILGVRADSSKVRGKVLAATLGWAALNSLALARDLRRG